MEPMSRGSGERRRSPALYRATLIAGIGISLAAPCLAAQAGERGAAGSTARKPAACAPIPAERGATITFGREGGNIRPRSWTIAADGRIGGDTLVPTRDSIAPIPADAVAALARFARTGGFWELRSRRVRRPPANPDAAREFIAVSLTCGAHRVEFVPDDAPRTFTEFFALLSSVTRAR
jgi:hypothetical protein